MVIKIGDKVKIKSGAVFQDMQFFKWPENWSNTEFEVVALFSK